MELNEILTESELSTINPDIIVKLESAFNSELTKAVASENAKGNAKFNKLLDTVGSRADAQIAKAIGESVAKVRDNAVNDKLYGVLRSIAAVLESAGIPTSEATKKLKEELAQCNVNLKKAYAEREHVKEQLNDQQKKNYIYKEVQGMKPEVVDAVMNHFIHYDIREIDREAITRFLAGGTGDAYMMDVDPEAGGELNMDRVTAALSEIDHDLEIDVPSTPATRRGRFESLGRGLRAERVSTYTPNVTFESLEGMEIPADFGGQDTPDEDVNEAISQMKEFSMFGGFS